jgi:hypothetical protein
MIVISINRKPVTKKAKLTANDPDTIRRLITNQREEHMAHAFRAGYGGMQDYNRLVPVLRKLPPEELSQWLDLMDEVYESHRLCQPCGCKVLSYLILISKDLLPERHAAYFRRYEDHIRRWPPAGGRDFMNEVIDSLYRGKDHSNAKAHQAWWHSVYETSLRADEERGFDL